MEIELKDAHACFRCGKMLGPFTITDSGRAKCGECHEEGIVTFLQALDLLNDHYLTGELEPIEDQEYYEIIMELQDNE